MFLERVRAIYLKKMQDEYERYAVDHSEMLMITIDCAELAYKLAMEVLTEDMAEVLLLEPKMDYNSICRLLYGMRAEKLLKAMNESRLDLSR